jgi:hypothetical protein
MTTERWLLRFLAPSPYHTVTVSVVGPPTENVEVVRASDLDEALEALRAVMPWVLPGSGVVPGGYLKQARAVLAKHEEER